MVVEDERAVAQQGPAWPGCSVMLRAAHQSIASAAGHAGSWVHMMAVHSGYEEPTGSARPPGIVIVPSRGGRSPLSRLSVMAEVMPWFSARA